MSFVEIFANGLGQIVDDQCELESRPIRLAMNKLDKAINDEIANTKLEAAQNLYRKIPVSLSHTSLKLYSVYFLQ